MQAPGRTDEDPRGGFAHGGWAQAGNDPVMSRVMSGGMSREGGGLRLGRRTYEILAASWGPDDPRQRRADPAADRPPAALRLADSVTTPAGVIIATYVTAGG